MSLVDDLACLAAFKLLDQDPEPNINMHTCVDAKYGSMAEKPGYLHLWRNECGRFQEE